jgi:hypothetical protein
MHTLVLWKQIFHISVPDIGYGVVECRGIRTGSRDSLGVLQTTFSDYATTYVRARAHTHTHTHNVVGLLLRLQGLVLCPFPEPDESNGSFQFLYP